MSDRPVSLLDGRWAYEWDALLRGVGERGQQASQRATTSSRTPGQVNRGSVYKTDFAHAEIHLCKCGQKQHLHLRCLQWICEAPGHARHFCEEAT